MATLKTRAVPTDGGLHKATASAFTGILQWIVNVLMSPADLGFVNCVGNAMAITLRNMGCKFVNIMKNLLQSLINIYEY